jgi:RNA polymerase sigma-70 factor (ECF subfamily)
MTIFSHLIVGQIPGLRRYARALTGGKKENADDLVQDTLERAYVKWHLFKLGTDLRPWLFSIMHNVFVNEVRLLKHRVTMSSIDDERMKGMPATQLEHVQVRETLTAVGRLAPELREVLILVTIETFSYAETAKVLDIPLGTVMSRLSRARNQLRVLTGEPARAHTRAGLRLVE